MAKKGSNNIIKIILVFSFVFIIVPISIFGIIYNVNDSFKQMANNYLRDKPGAVGDFFNKYPTEGERIDKITEIVDYYFKIDNKTAADKLYIIKQNDEVLYHEIIDKMKDISFNKTENIINIIRDIELRKDLLVSIHDEIVTEEETKLNDDVDKLENASLYLALKQINDIYLKSNEKTKLLPQIITEMSPDRATDILINLNKEVSNEMLNQLNDYTRDELQSIIINKKLKNNELKELSSVYEVKNLNECINEIGNTNKYTIKELAIIYENLSSKKASEILKQCTDDEFINNLYTQIRMNEKLNNVEKSKTIEINKTINYLNEYDNKINELVNIYEKMNTEDLAQIVEKMMLNNKKINVHRINENEILEMSDSKIIIDVLKNMKKSTVSEILEKIDSRKATELTRKLAL